MKEGRMSEHLDINYVTINGVRLHPSVMPANAEIAGDDGVRDFGFITHRQAHAAILAALTAEIGDEATADRLTVVVMRALAEPEE
jgi:hypothetical protein